MMSGHMVPWISPALSAGGIVIEAIGVVIFTLDVFRANKDLIKELSSLRQGMRTVNLESNSIMVSDGATHGSPIQFHGAQISDYRDRSKLPVVLSQRRWLRIGAALVAAGLLFQLAGTVLPLFP